MDTAVLMDTRTHVASIGEVPMPEPAPGEVLVRSKVVGLCRSDIELLHGHLDAQLPVLQPIVPGHEWSGVVEAVGEGVTGFEPGQRVVGECVIADNHWFGFTAHGAAAQRCLVPARLLHVFPDDMDFATAALIEPFTIAYNAIAEAGGVDDGDVVVIIGAGMIGQACTAIAAASGAQVLVVDPVEQRRSLAATLGAAGGAPSLDALRTQLPEAGADLVVEASGTAAGIAATFELARFAGRIVNIGICADREVSAPLHLIQAKNLRVRGVTGSAGIWPEAIAFLQRHAIDLSPVITASFPMHDIDAALAATEHGNVKVQLVVEE